MAGDPAAVGAAAVRNCTRTPIVTEQVASSVMANFRGFGELQSPRDLLIKLRHDLERMESSPQDQYAAFDFFVTAEHIVDWLHPSDQDHKRRNALRSKTPLLRITSQIANGAKHFEARNKRHKSVVGIEKDRYVEAGYTEDGYVAEPLLIRLTEQEASDFGQPAIEAIWLARRVLECWTASGKLGLPRATLVDRGK
jgi:hypothetical protein